jgi:hypothetical protein
MLRLLLICILWCPVFGKAQMILPDLRMPAFTSSDSNHVVQNLNSFIRDNQKVFLTWKVNDSIVPEFFSIERSSNGRPFEVVGVLKVPADKKSFEWTDDAPGRGRNFYRISYRLTEGPNYHSAASPVFISEDPEYKFYPNPVDNVLIIRSDPPLDVLIVDPSGKIRIGPLRVQGLGTVNVSSLERGLYLLRITNKITNVLTQEKLMKN